MLLFGGFYLKETLPDGDNGVFKGKFRIQTTKARYPKESFSTTTFKGVWEDHRKEKQQMSGLVIFIPLTFLK